MQFLYSALSSNELKALYILLPPAHLYTPAPHQLLNGWHNPDTRYKAQRVMNCTIAFSVYCQVLIYGLVNISGTNLAPGLKILKTERHSIITIDHCLGNLNTSRKLLVFFFIYLFYLFIYLLWGGGEREGKTTCFRCWVPLKCGRSVCHATGDKCWEVHEAVMILVYYSSVLRKNEMAF